MKVVWMTPFEFEGKSRKPEAWPYIYFCDTEMTSRDPLQTSDHRWLLARTSVSYLCVSRESLTKDVNVAAGDLPIRSWRILLVRISTSTAPVVGRLLSSGTRGNPLLQLPALGLGGIIKSFITSLNLSYFVSQQLVMVMSTMSFCLINNQK